MEGILLDDAPIRLLFKNAWAEVCLPSKPHSGPSDCGGKACSVRDWLARVVLAGRKNSCLGLKAGPLYLYSHRVLYLRSSPDGETTLSANCRSNLRKSCVLRKNRRFVMRMLDAWLSFKQLPGKMTEGVDSSSRSFTARSLGKVVARVFLNRSFQIFPKTWRDIVQVIFS